ncbi:MAG TPA: hypothetical protein VFX49_11015 [Chloroflexota bacterium]|nr:hypothetical protein [Chloroflexota bacterium]
MDYGALIRQAWETTWRHRFMWVLALFAGGAVGAGGRNGMGFRFGGPRGWDRIGERTDAGDFGPFRAWRGGEGWRLPDGAEGVQRVAEGLVQWGIAHIALIAAGIALLVMLGIGLLVLALIARGGMAEATVDLATGRSSSLGRAWRTGTRLIWRYAGLWLVLAGIGLAVAIVVGGTVAAGVGAAALTGAPRLFAVLGALVGIPLALAAIVCGIALSVVVAYAERAIYAEDTGPIDALRTGWHTLRANLGTSALLWLINLAMVVGIGIVGALIGLTLVVALGGAGVAIWAAAGWSAPLFAYGAVGALALLAAALTAGAVANTFFWNYWSLAYVRLTGRDAGTEADAIPA